MILVNRTYEIITEESAAVGDVEESGFLAENEQFTFRELVDKLRGGEPSCYPITYANEHTWVTQYGDMDYVTGNYENESIHFADSPRKAKYWIKALKLAINRS